MFKNTLYDNYRIDFNKDTLNYTEGYVFIINDKRQIKLTDGNVIIMKLEDVKADYDINYMLYIGDYKNVPSFIVSVNTSEEYTPLINIYDINEDLYYMATRSVLVDDWYKSNQYCGRCGTHNVIDEKDMMLKCPKCGQMHYTRIAPAIIVAINKDGKLLMAKHSYYTKIRYALIAGFIEAGEGIKQAVKREVKEEVGIDVKNIEYVTSQSWPYPNSLMIGFTADYAGGDIVVDGNEILEAHWFSPDKIDVPESDISISAYLINKFIKDHKK